MRFRDCASWDCGHRHMGGWEEGKSVGRLLGWGEFGDWAGIVPGFRLIYTWLRYKKNKLKHIPYEALRMMDCTHYGSNMIDNHSMDRLVKDVLMMELVMHTEKNDTVFYTEKTGMLMLVVEIDVGGMTADVVDKLTCSSDNVQPWQVDLSQLEWLLLLIIQSISLTGSLHSLQLLARRVGHSQQILESSVHVFGSTYTAPFGSSMSHTYPSPASVDDCQHPTKSLYLQDLSF
uniref:Uncharacterized protein n=1 Tax=Tanacetum cinerariifolium TaxID=118510 RepID=A0A6L2LVI5_TANCI|nr:hypothetical protein [Tanacetum cinerariifolium]